MTAALGLDIGTQRTGWARSGPGDAGVVVGSVPSVVSIGGQTVGGFVERLGDPAPVIVGSTPYGVESLVAVVVGVALAASGMARRVGLVHPRSLDDYRIGLLVESVRLAGVAVADLLLVPDDVALAAAAAAGLRGDLALVGGAAIVAAGRRTDETADDGVRWASTLGIVGGGVVGGGVAGGVAAGSATATAAGEAVAPAAFSGVPLAPPSAASTGFAGTPLPAAGATAGSPLAAPAAGAVGVPVATTGEGFGGVALQVARKGPGRLPAIIGSAVIGVAAVVGAVIVASGSDGPSESASPPAVATTAAAVESTTLEIASTVEPTTSTSTSTTSTTSTTTTIAETSTTVPVIDPTGRWHVVTDCQVPNCEGGESDISISALDPVTGVFTVVVPEVDSATGQIVGDVVVIDLQSSGFVTHTEMTMSPDGQTMTGTWAVGAVGNQGDPPGVLGNIVLTRLP